MIQEAIGDLIAGADLGRTRTRAVMDQIMSGQATDAQIGAFLVALRIKGETIDEIVGCAEVMREKATPITTTRPDLIDTCGTGGDASGTFNISTTVAFVACGAGLAVAKHGNRSISSQCGSAGRAGCARGQCRSLAGKGRRVHRRSRHWLPLRNSLARGDETRHWSAQGVSDPHGL